GRWNGDAPLCCRSIRGSSCSSMGMRCCMPRTRLGSSWSDGKSHARASRELSHRMPLRIAVIGVGHLGRHHARILSSLPGADLVAAVDTNRARAEEVAAAHQTPPSVAHRELLCTVGAGTL